MAFQRITAADMTPITDRVLHRSYVTGREEVWSAVSVETAPDGTDPLWTYERREEPGTPWQITHTPTGRWTLSTSLAKARRDTMNGTILRILDANDVEQQRSA